MCGYLSACQVTRYLHLVERVVFAQRDFRLMFFCGILQDRQAVHLPYNSLNKYVYNNRKLISNKKALTWR